MEKHHYYKIFNLILFIGVIIVLLIFIQPSKEGYVIKDPDVKIVKGSELEDFHANGDFSELKETVVLNCDEIKV